MGRQYSVPAPDADGRRGWRSAVLDDVVPVLRCPVCRRPLLRGPGALRCEAGHAFDVARQGYVSLLTGRAPAATETPAMLARGPSSSPPATSRR